MSFENVIAEVELAYGEQQFAEDTGWNNSSLPFLGLLHSRFLLLSCILKLHFPSLLLGCSISFLSRFLLLYFVIFLNYAFQRERPVSIVLNAYSSTVLLSVGTLWPSR